eukprot:3412390-Prymnesium_polylepis.1
MERGLRAVRPDCARTRRVRERLRERAAWRRGDCTLSTREGGTTSEPPTGSLFGGETQRHSTTQRSFGPRRSGSRPLSTRGSTAQRVSLWFETRRPGAH